SPALSQRGSRGAPPPFLIGGGGSAEAGEDRSDHRVLVPLMDQAPALPEGHAIWSLEGQTMGTTWSVQLVAPPAADREVLAAAIQQELDAVVAVFSPWDPTSEISRFNAAPPGVWALSSPLWSVLDAAMDLA